MAVSPWEEVQSEGGAGGKGGQKTKTMGGREIWWEWRDGGERRVIMPDEIEVEKVAKQVANGEVVRALLLNPCSSFLPFLPFFKFLHYRSILTILL